MLITGLPPKNEMEILGREMRNYARENPCMVPTDAYLPAYGRMVAGKYRVMLCLESFTTRLRWHASVSILHEIGSDVLANPGLPQEALVHTYKWPSEEKSIAREILGYVMGPVRFDEDQDGGEMSGLFSLHWHITADPRTLHMEVEHA